MNTQSDTHTATRATDGHIDTHAHLWSTKYLGQLKSLMQQAGASDAAADARVDHVMVDSRDLSARIKMMDQAGVQYQMLSAHPKARHGAALIKLRRWRAKSTICMPLKIRWRCCSS